MTNEKITIQDKKRKLRKLRSLLNTACSISNDLVGEEESYSKNQNHLYKIREEISSAKQGLEFVFYK